ncbi:S8 family serine peptidase [Actinoplanes oblitus]|uniref:S8 family serine peptidase n=1 Tax=Actinoplanes oblitus TaxID=3040509 RepID=A0ABY8W8G8_9ACTN|nr:S8 family serine peptidase [Actinoplanes oblitus]WIM92728.1 S8 family serine peptidase [Actinoplanes oblitus]
MSMDKFEPRLVEAIGAETARARDRGIAAGEVTEGQKFHVTISHHETLSAPESHGGPAGLEQLQLRAQVSQQPIIDRLDGLGASARGHTLTNAVTAELTPAQIEQVAQLDEVKLIRLERLDKVTTMNQSVAVIEAREAWEEFRTAGSGVRVAVLDTGIDGTHPALTGKVVDEFSTAGEPVTVPGDHGTHCAGTIASNDAVYRGVAWQADLINIKVLTAAGMGTPAGVIDGLEQAVRRNAQVASLSLGWSEIFHGWVCDDADCILCQAADNASRLGVTVVVAAGNEGTAGAGTGQLNIRHPGAARRVVTVGAVDKAKQLASFSSIGPGSGRVGPASPIRLTKPDLAGPGADIVSSVLGGGFASFNGTSMATPHVAAVAALVIEQNPGIRPMVVKKLLEDTAERLSYGPNETGYGLVNAFAAMLPILGKAA